MNEPDQQLGPPGIFARLWGTLQRSRQGAWDATVSMIPQFVGVVTGLIGSVLVVRGLGPHDVGRLALVASMMAIAGALSDLGLGQTAVRYASRAAAHGDSEGMFAVLRWAFRLRLMLVLVVTIVLFAAAPLLTGGLWHDDALTGLLQLGLMGGVFAALSSIPTVYFQSVCRFGTNAFVQSGQRIVSFLGILVLAALSWWSTQSVIVVTVVTSAAGAIAFMLLVPRSALWRREDMKGQPGLRWLWRSPAAKLVPGAAADDTPHVFVAYNVLSTVIVTLTLQCPVWLMGYFLEKGQVGVFDAASRFTLPLTIVLTGLTTALWPRASAITSGHDALPLLRRTFRLSLLVAAAGAVYAVLVPMLAPWLFGQRFAASVLLGQVLCLRYCLAILVCPVGVVGYAFGMVRIYWIVNLVQFVVVAALCLVLTPRIGPLGAALALVVNEIVSLMTVGVLLFRRLRRGRPDLGVEGV